MWGFPESDNDDGDDIVVDSQNPSVCVWVSEATLMFWHNFEVKYGLNIKGNLQHKLLMRKLPPSPLIPSLKLILKMVITASLEQVPVEIRTVQENVLEMIDYCCRCKQEGLSLDHVFRLDHFHKLP